MNDQTNSNLYKNTFLSDYNLRLTGQEFLPNATRKPTLTVKVHNNLVQLIVWTNLPNDKDSGKITAEITPVTLMMLKNIIDLFCKNENTEKAYVITNKKHKFMGGKRSEEMMVDSRIIIERDDTGALYLAIISWDTTRPKIKFTLQPPDAHYLTYKDGTTVPPNILTNIFAKAWIDCICEISSKDLFHNYVDPSNKFSNNGSKQTMPQNKKESIINDDDLKF